MNAHICHRTKITTRYFPLVLFNLRFCRGCQSVTDRAGGYIDIVDVAVWLKLNILPSIVKLLRSVLSLTCKSLVSEDGRASSALENGFVLPWGQPPERQTSTAASDVTPGEFVLRTLFAEFTVLAEKKIETILTEPLVSSCINIDFRCIGFVYSEISERLENENDYKVM